jgi:PAS domain S-box-containing protein
MREAHAPIFNGRVFDGEIRSSRSILVVACVTIASSYLVPTLVGILVLNPKTVWPLWPGCAILVTGLLLLPVSLWLLVIPASFAGFAIADLQAGLPLSSSARFIPGNTVEVLVSAFGLRYCFAGVPRLNSVRALLKYCFFAVVLAPSAGAFFSASGIASDYWTGWKIVFLSEVMAFLTVAPVLLSWITEGRVFLRRSRSHHLEGGLLLAGLALVSYIVFTLPEGSRTPALFYTLVPFLLWSALRFGWLGISTSLCVVTSLSIWGAVYGRGPFSNLVPLTDPLPLQSLLIFVSIPFMVLSALAEEHDQDSHIVRESEGRFRLVANAAPTLIWMSGTDKLCTYFNKPWLDFTGRTIDEELGNGWAEGVHEDDFQRCLQTYTESFNRRERFEMEYRLRRHDGEYRWILDIGVPRYGEDGSFAGYIGSCIDVTERKRADEARFRHAAIVESSEDAIISMDLDAVITSWNAGAQRIYGYTESEAVGQPITSLVPPELWDEEKIIQDKLRRGGRVEHYETTRVTKAGESVAVSLTISPIKDSPGKLVGFCRLAHDITARKQMERTLSGVSGRLIEAQERERGRIARELHDDICQKLALVSIELERLEMKLPDSVTQQRSQLGESRKKIMDISADVQMISHELHSSKLGYLGAAVAMKGFCKEFSEHHNLQIEFVSRDVPRDLPPDISICLFRVLQEALQNAAKHSGVKRFEVQLWGTTKEVHLTVSDLGSGFDTQAATQSQGLGLTSMQERVRLVNGNLAIESKPNCGTTIRVRVPLVSGHQEQRAAV